MRHLLVLFALLLASLANAGDEVDYSAPYLVVEDGKLVTKYPGQEHPAGEAAAAEPAEFSAATASPDAAAGQPWFIAAGVLVVLVGGLAATLRVTDAD